MTLEELLERLNALQPKSALSAQIEVTVEGVLMGITDVCYEDGVVVLEAKAEDA